MTDPVLVLAWLVLAHLVADFVLQGNRMAAEKGTRGRNGWAALAAHGGHVALCLVPVALAFGGPGLAYLVLVTLSHVLVDRWKVRATARAERGAVAASRGRPEAADAAAAGLGSAWTPWPGLLFLADQALHVVILAAGWLLLLAPAPLLPGFAELVDGALGHWDRSTVHAAVLTAVVLVSLFLVNTRAAYYFVVALVSPREPAPATTPGPAPGSAPGSAPGTGPAASAPPAAPAGYTLRLGPLVATLEPGAPLGRAGESRQAPRAAPAPAPARAPVTAVSAAAAPGGAPARIGATIGALERLLIVALVVAGAEVAVGFVITAKTIARFRQLDDRGFAEYYLLGTLASVSVALGSALVAQAVLRTLP